MSPNNAAGKQNNEGENCDNYGFERVLFNAFRHYIIFLLLLMGLRKMTANVDSTALFPIVASLVENSKEKIAILIKNAKTLQSLPKA